MIVTYPLNNVLYTAEDAEIYNCSRSSGVLADDSFIATVTGSDNNVTVHAGIGWIHNSQFAGKAVAMKKAETLDLGVADTRFDRTDTIALVYDSVSNKTELKVKKGLIGSGALPAERITNENVYELHLFHVRRKQNATTITENDITDLRADPKWCGYMADAVSKVDETLSKAGWLADAKAVGDKLKQETKAVRPVNAGGTGTNTNRIKLKTKQLDVGASSTVEAFYIPYLKMGFIRIIATTKSILNAGDTINVCNLIDEKYAPNPRQKNPLNARCVSRTAPSKNYPVEAMMSWQGYIELASVGEQIPKGKEFHIWGFWFVD